MFNVLSRKLNLTVFLHLFLIQFWFLKKRTRWFSKNGIIFSDWVGVGLLHKKMCKNVMLDL